MEDISFTMKARIKKEPDTHFVNNNRMIEWVSEEIDEHGHPEICRIPEPTADEFEKAQGFRAAGMLYAAVGSLAATAVDRDKGLYNDIFGRPVLMVKERFPCFDSADYLYENRYYRWFYLMYKDTITCVYYEDGSRTVKVTEDVRVIEGRIWKQVEQSGVIQHDVFHNDVFQLPTD